MSDQIEIYLNKLKDKHKINILYACETGSRAWGVPSPNSDYDIRIIYNHSPDWYLSVNEKPDNIMQVEDDIDSQAWDLKKTLSLLSKSNIILFEWLQSAKIYAGCPLFREGLIDLSKKYFQPRKAIYHYLGLSNTLIKKHFEKDTLPLKKYFIIVRSILASIWIKENQTPAPILFTDLLPILEKQPKVLLAVHQLIRLKKETNDGKPIKRIPALDAFIFEHRKASSVFAERLPKQDKVDMEALDLFFRGMLEHYKTQEQV